MSEEQKDKAIEIADILLNNSKKQIEELQKEVKQLKANHNDLVNRLAILRQRPDLPVDRIPAFKRIEVAEELLKKAYDVLEDIHTTCCVNADGQDFDWSEESREARAKIKEYLEWYK